MSARQQAQPADHRLIDCSEDCRWRARHTRLSAAATRRTQLITAIDRNKANGVRCSVAVSLYTLSISAFV